MAVVKGSYNAVNLPRLRLWLGRFFGIHPREGEEEGKEKGKREKEKGGFAGLAGSFRHGCRVEQWLGAMHLNSYPQLTGSIRELIFNGNTTKVW
jgi:hypothetical protein